MRLSKKSSQQRGSSRSSTLRKRKRKEKENESLDEITSPSYPSQRRLRASPKNVTPIRRCSRTRRKPSTPQTPSSSVSGKKNKAHEFSSPTLSPHTPKTRRTPRKYSSPKTPHSGFMSKRIRLSLVQTPLRRGVEGSDSSESTLRSNLPAKSPKYIVPVWQSSKSSRTRRRRTQNSTSLVPSQVEVWFGFPRPLLYEGEMNREQRMADRTAESQNFRITSQYTFGDLLRDCARRWHKPEKEYELRDDLDCVWPTVGDCADELEYRAALGDSVRLLFVHIDDKNPWCVSQDTKAEAEEASNHPRWEGNEIGGSLSHEDAEMAHSFQYDGPEYLSDVDMGEPIEFAAQDGEMPVSPEAMNISGIASTARQKEVEASEFEYSQSEEELEPEAAWIDKHQLVEAERMAAEEKAKAEAAMKKVKDAEREAQKAREEAQRVQEEAQIAVAQAHQEEEQIRQQQLAEAERAQLAEQTAKAEEKRARKAQQELLRLKNLVKEKDEMLVAQREKLRTEQDQWHQSLASVRQALNQEKQALETKVKQLEKHILELPATLAQSTESAAHRTLLERDRALSEMRSQLEKVTAQLALAQKRSEDAFQAQQASLSSTSTPPATVSLEGASIENVAELLRKRTHELKQTSSIREELAQATQELERERAASAELVAQFAQERERWMQDMKAALEQPQPARRAISESPVDGFVASVHKEEEGIPAIEKVQVYAYTASGFHPVCLPADEKVDHIRNGYLYTKKGNVYLPDGKKVACPRVAGSLQIDQLWEAAPQKKDGNCTPEMSAVLRQQVMVTWPLHNDTLFRRLLPSRPVTQVCGSANRFMALSLGTVYAWGSGPLGFGTETDLVLNPTPLSTLEGAKICQIACGLYHSLALDESGIVYSWGVGAAVGHGAWDEKSNFIPEPCAILNLGNIKQVAAGDFQSVALTKSGRIYTWGNGKLGLLGHGSRDEERSPRLVESIPAGIKQVACTATATFALTYEGVIIAMGSTFGWNLSRSIVDRMLTSHYVPYPLNTLPYSFVGIDGTQHTLLMIRGERQGSTRSPIVVD